MKLLVVTVLSVLLLEPATVQAADPPATSLTDIARSSGKGNVSLLNLLLGESIPPPPSKGPVNGALIPLQFEDKKSGSRRSLRTRRAFVTNDRQDSNLEWVEWTGELPNWAVAITNDYTGSEDFICSAIGPAGFYRESKGPYCYYGGNHIEKRASEFYILVNKDDFELLVWRSSENGNLPEHSIHTEVEDLYYRTYVGRNKYGLGKIVTRDKRFALPYEGREHWYSSYQVLTVDPVTSQSITNVRYAIDQKKILTEAPETITSYTAVNKGCTTERKTGTKTQSTMKTSTWNTGGSITVSSSVKMNAGIPFVASLEVTIGVQKTFSYSFGGSETEAETHSLSLEKHVPPNHFCVMRLEGRKTTVDIPYTATVTSQYNIPYHTYSGTKSTTISGMYRGVNVVDIRGVWERCQPNPGARPC